MTKWVVFQECGGVDLCLCVKEKSIPLAEEDLL